MQTKTIHRIAWSLLFIISAQWTMAQQNLPLILKSISKETQVQKGDKFVTDTTEYQPFFHFFGIGNLSEESLEKINGGGKLAFMFTKNKAGIGVTPSKYFFSFNKNASNNDSLLVSTLLFPEVGSHSFLATAYWPIINSTTNNTLVTAGDMFFEFATKKINLSAENTDGETETIGFNTLHYTFGYKHTYGLKRRLDSKDYTTALGMTTYISNTNIPDEDNGGLETIIKGTATKNNFWSAGVKLGLEINGFQIFADLRHCFNNDKKLPIKDLKGFNSNIGVSFNAEIFSL